MPRSLKEMYGFKPPKHEATMQYEKGRSRWTCLCGKQMDGWSEDPDVVMRTYAQHAGLVEKPIRR